MNLTISILICFVWIVGHANNCTTESNKLAPHQKSKHRMSQTATTPRGMDMIGLNVTQANSNDNFAFAIDIGFNDDGVLNVTTNGVNTIIDPDGIFNISFTCSGNTPVTFDALTISTVFESSFNGGYLPTQIITHTSHGPICCNHPTCIILQVCSTCNNIQTATCCGKACT